MKEKVLILADTDVDWLKSVEPHLIFHLPENVSVEVFTKKAALQNWLSKHEFPDRMAVSREFLDCCPRGAARQLVVLTENRNILNSESAVEYQTAAKYDPLSVLFSQIIPDSWNVKSEIPRTRVVTLIGAVGGTGCTTLSMSVAGSLADLSQKVLALSLSDSQDFKYFFPNLKTMTAREVRDFKNLNNTKELVTYDQTRHISIVKPLPGYRSNCGVTVRNYSEFVNQVKSEGQYQWIVVDAGSEIFGAADIISLSDGLIQISLPDPFSVFKASQISRILRTDRKSRFIRICNRYRRSNEQTGEMEISVDAYIPELNKPSDLSEWNSLSEIRQIVHSMF